MTPTAGEQPHAEAGGPTFSATDVRAAWLRLEAVHAVTYFAPESRQAARDCGLRGFWMGYFAFRAAPLGPVDAAEVTDAFYNFAPAMVARAIPAAWQVAAPDRLVEVRGQAAAAALRRIVPDLDAQVTAALVDALAAAARGPLPGTAGDADRPDRPLYAANRRIDTPTDPVRALWQHATTLREHRGDGHVAVLRSLGVDGCEAHLLIAAERAVPESVLRDNRGWTAVEWEEARGRLRSRGLLDGHGALTERGRTLRQQVEAQTDAAAAEPYRHLPPGTGLADVIVWLDAVAQAVAASGVIPYPNPMGLPR